MDIKRWPPIVARLFWVEIMRKVRFFSLPFEILLSLWFYLFAFRHESYLGFVISHYVSLYSLIQPITLNFNNRTDRVQLMHGPFMLQLYGSAEHKPSPPCSPLCINTRHSSTLMKPLGITNKGYYERGRTDNNCPALACLGERDGCGLSQQSVNLYS
jgi:hypothetical protein